ncbi:hypothetical protein PV327_009457 [Microctonus hyperodae]|uniref:Uncharacterized protein n=1 Tax=Microctonus hyperodae TaxID=165561 RepID=A0AA39FUW0_MICHY|nr:hypothetical protein PV327_009457 [Microctonus hyperodae]
MRVEIALGRVKEGADMEALMIILRDVYMTHRTREMDTTGSDFHIPTAIVDVKLMGGLFSELQRVETTRTPPGAQVDLAKKMMATECKSLRSRAFIGSRGNA